MQRADLAESFVVAFTLPYLLNAPYANLQSKVGFIFGSLAFCAVIFVYFCIPECSGRSFQEIDNLFEAGVSVRKFKSYELESDVASIKEPRAPESDFGTTEKTKAHAEVVKEKF